MPAKKYTFELLQKFCSENNIELLQDYSNTKLVREVKLETRCLTENCPNISHKNVIRLMYKSGSYCDACAHNRGKEKQKKTCLEKYGSEFALQVDSVKKKSRDTSMAKYGTARASQSEIVKQKMKDTNLARYGVEYASTSTIIKERVKQTNLERYGVEFACQNEEIKQKIRDTNMEKYGTTCPRQHNAAVKQKAEQTNIGLYGTANPFGSEEIQQKIRDTNMERYGVEFPNQNEDIMEKTSKNAYKVKEYLFPSGKTAKIQGYEFLGLDWLLYSEGVPEHDIVVGAKNVPRIWYTDDQQHKHRHSCVVDAPRASIRHMHPVDGFFIHRPDAM